MNQMIEIECVSCSKDEPTLHEILKSGQNPVVKCTECEHIHSVKIETPKQVTVRVIVSKDRESYKCSNEMDAKEVIYVDDELIVDDESKEDVFPIIVTSIESGGKRVEYSKSEDIGTLWGRAIDEVSIKYAIHARTKTRSITKKVKGDHEFVVGDIFTLDRSEVILTHIKIRDGYFRSRNGDMTEAKYVKRIFTKEIKRGSTAWSRGT
ncbi:MAG: hypothetical protein HF967_00780 [Methanosarcinales archaeon]|nr:hypothetical protein [Methanosarcinales archaeon]